MARPPRLPTLGLGMAQVQLRHWRASGLLDGMRPTPRRLALVRDWQANDRACESFLRARSASG